MIAVIAKNQQQFDVWLRDLSDADRDKFVYFGSASNFRGREFTDVIKIGTYWENDEWPTLELFARSRIR